MVRFKAFTLSVLHIFLPYAFLSASLFLMFYFESGLFHPLASTPNMTAMFIISMIIIIVGSAIISPIEIVTTSFIDVTTPGGTIEVSSFGSGSYFVGGRGDAGIGLLILKFIINILISPFIILYWIIITFMICFKTGYAEYFINLINEKKKIVGTIILASGFLFSLIGFIIGLGTTNKYSYKKFSFVIDQYNLTETKYYKDDFVRDTYVFRISFQHPQIDNLESIQFQDSSILVNGCETNPISLNFRINDYYSAKQEKGFIYCVLDNYYIEPGHEGYGYVGLDLYETSEFIKLKENNVSDCKFECSIREVHFKDINFSFIRLNWLEYDIKNNI